MSLIRKKLGFIANRNGCIQKNNRDIPTYDTPISFEILYMPKSNNYKIEKFGEDKNNILIAFFNLNEWYGRINVGDKAYLINENVCTKEIIKYAENDNEYCLNANYEVITCELQNLKLKVEFKKIR